METTPEFATSRAAEGPGPGPGPGSGPGTLESGTWPPADTRKCRVCYAGADTEATLPEACRGRLFSPCLCRGTARFIHVDCLDDWRYSDGGRGKRFYQCPTCMYEYRIARTVVYAAIVNPVIVGLLSLIVIAGTVIVVAYLIKAFAFLALGAVIAKKTWALTQQIILIAVMIIGFIMFLIVASKSDVKIPSVVIMTDDAALFWCYITSGLGFIFFVVRVFAEVDKRVGKVMAVLGTPVLDVQTDTKIE